MISRSAAFQFPLVLALAAACAPVRTDSGGAAARNTCAEGPCGAYKQAGTPPSCTADQGICQAKAKLDLTVVITLPEGGVYAPGETFIAKYAELPKARTCKNSPSCVALPGLGEFAGLYSATNDVAQKVKFYLGEGNRSIPTIPMFRRAWTFVDGALPVDVALLGMPLQPLVGVRADNEQGSFPGASDNAIPRPSVGFNVLVPAGVYEQTLLPAAQFTAPYPPVITQGAAPTAPQLPHDFKNAEVGKLGAGLEPVAHPVTVTRGGGLSLDGWTLFLRDQRTKRPISSAPRLSKADVVNVFTVNQTPPNAGTDPASLQTVRSGVELVLAPPAGESPRLPELVLPSPTNSVSRSAKYPLLPFQAIVEGALVADDGSRVPGDVVVVSQSITMLESEVSPADLSFVDEFATASDGTFSRSLPPGTYTAIVTPSAQSGLARTIVDLEVTTPSSPGQRQGGKVLRVDRTELWRGTVRAADGRPLAGAEVEAHPSTLLPYGADVPARDPRRWPRTVRTRTIGGGEFVLVLDPGGVFDVVVRPASGTSFPWVVQQQVTSPSHDLAFEVPAPYIISAQLQDPTGLPASQALIQAFIGVPSTVPVTTCTFDNDAAHLAKPLSCPATAPRCVNGHCVAVVALEIGRARADDQGRFTLFLDGRPR